MSATRLLLVFLVYFVSYSEQRDKHKELYTSRQDYSISTRSPKSIGAEVDLRSKTNTLKFPDEELIKSSNNFYNDSKYLIMSISSSERQQIRRDNAVNHLSALDYCPGGLMYNSRCFYLGEGIKTWDACRTHCLSLGRRMLCIDSAATNAFLASYFVSASIMWIGLNDLSGEGGYVWSGGVCSPSTYRKWAGGQPANSAGEDCVEIQGTGGNWYDSACSLARSCGCESTWTFEPTIYPTANPTILPTVSPTCRPTIQPSAQPSAQPSSQPSAQPLVHPTATPTAQPSNEPSSLPSGQPSVQPTDAPSSQPSEDPSMQPTAQPTSKPSSQPITQPSAQPSEQPSTQPTIQPSVQPSNQPSSEPSSQPSTQPSNQPSSQPSRQPSAEPSSQPTVQPSAYPTIQPSGQPTYQPSTQPSTQPSAQPSSQPSGEPSSQPSMQPSGDPSSQPSAQPSTQPSIQPSGQPSGIPSNQPSGLPSLQPILQPTGQPTSEPSAQPSHLPSSQPSRQPSSMPSDQPSSMPTLQPSTQPSAQPVANPTTQPSSRPSNQPSAQPAASPTIQPSSQPSAQPSCEPSFQPTNQPSLQPFARPSRQPNAVPTCQPNSGPSEQPTSEWTTTFDNTLSFTTLAVQREIIWACHDVGICVSMETKNGEILSKYDFPSSIRTVSAVAVDTIVISGTSAVGNSSDAARCSIQHQTHLLCDRLVIAATTFVDATFVSCSNVLVIVGHYDGQLSAALLNMADFTMQSYVYTIYNVRSVTLSQIQSLDNFVGSFVAGTGVRAAGEPVNYIILGQLRSDYGGLSAMYLTPMCGSILNSAELVNGMALEYENPDSFIAGGLQLSDGAGMHAYVIRANGLLGIIAYCVRFRAKRSYDGMKSALSNPFDEYTSVARGVVLVGSILYTIVELNMLDPTAATKYVAVLRVSAVTGVVIKQVNIAARNGSFTCSKVTSSGYYLTMVCELQYSGPTRNNTAIIISTNSELLFGKLSPELVRTDSFQLQAENVPFLLRSLLVTTKRTETTTSHDTYATSNEAPSRSPTFLPTPHPTSTPPVSQPSSSPSATPSVSPQPTSPPSTGGPTNTYKPTVKPTQRPSRVPSRGPTASPSVRHTAAPTVQTYAPRTRTPSAPPKAAQTSAPTRTPSAKPTRVPSTRATGAPTQVSVATPTRTPSAPPIGTASGTTLSNFLANELATILLSSVGGFIVVVWMVYCAQRLYRYLVWFAEKEQRRERFMQASDVQKPSQTFKEPRGATSITNTLSSHNDGAYMVGPPLFVDLEANIPKASSNNIIEAKEKRETLQRTPEVEQQRCVDISSIDSNIINDAAVQGNSDGNSSESNVDDSDMDVTLSAESVSNSYCTSPVWSDSASADELASDVTGTNSNGRADTNHSSFNLNGSSNYSGSVINDTECSLTESGDTKRLASRSESFHSSDSGQEDPDCGNYGSNEQGQSHCGSEEFDFISDKEEGTGSFFGTDDTGGISCINCYENSEDEVKSNFVSYEIADDMSCQNSYGTGDSAASVDSGQ